MSTMSNIDTTVPDETIQAVTARLSAATEKPWLIRGDDIEAILAEVRRLTADRAITHEQAVQACANVGVDLTCGACAAVFYTGVGSPHDVHTCAESDVWASLRAEADTLRRSIDAAHRETGDLREEVTEAIGLPWLPLPQPFGATAYACPDDRHIIEAVRAVVKERDEARAQVERLTDLVRHQRGALHAEGLITDAEYADLAGLTGSPARLEGYDALRGELALQKRATNVAIGERGALQAIRAYLDAVVTQPGRDDFPEWHALADEDRDRLQAWGDRVCQAGMDAENEATEEAEDAARHAAEQADILLTTIRLALGDNPAGNGWKPPTGVHPVVDLALNVSEERDGAVAALATARLDGARAMREVAAELLDEEPSVPNRVTAEIRALDPAAVVGSGS